MDHEEASPESFLLQLLQRLFCEGARAWVACWRVKTKASSRLLQFITALLNLRQNRDGAHRHPLNHWVRHYPVQLLLEVRISNFSTTNFPKATDHHICMQTPLQVAAKQPSSGGQSEHYRHLEPTERVQDLGIYCAWAGLITRKKEITPVNVKPSLTLPCVMSPTTSLGEQAGELSLLRCFLLCSSINPNKPCLRFWLVSCQFLLHSEPKNLESEPRISRNKIHLEHRQKPSICLQGKKYMAVSIPRKISFQHRSATSDQ